MPGRSAWSPAAMRRRTRCASSALALTTWDSGVRFGVPACRVTLAAWMLRRGRPQSAVMLLGHLQQAVDAQDSTQHPAKQDEVDRVLREAEAGSGAVAAQAWFAHGRSLSDGAVRAFVAAAAEGDATDARGHL